MNFDFELKYLNNTFYDTYDEVNYGEILRKEARSYSCIVLETKYDYFICLPFRTDMSHKYGYHFKNSVRSRTYMSGIDYSKMVILKDNSYFSTTNAVVDGDEYVEMVQNIEKIVTEANEYLDNYINYKKGLNNISARDFARAYRFSTLKYFDDIIL